MQLIGDKITDLVGNTLEEVKDLEGIQILVHGFIDVHAQFLLRLDSGTKCLLPLLHLLCSLFGAELVVDNLQGTGLLDDTVGGGTVGAVDSFTCKTEDSFAESLSLQVLEVWSPEAFQVTATVRFLQKHPSTSLGREPFWREKWRINIKRTLHMH